MLQNQEKIELFRTGSRICFGIGAVFLLIAILLFFLLDLRSIILIKLKKPGAGKRKKRARDSIEGKRISHEEGASDRVSSIMGIRKNASGRNTRKIPFRQKSAEKGTGTFLPQKKIHLSTTKIHFCDNNSVSDSNSYSNFDSHSNSHSYPVFNSDSNTHLDSNLSSYSVFHSDCPRGLSLPPRDRNFRILQKTIITDSTINDFESWRKNFSAEETVALEEQQSLPPP